MTQVSAQRIRRQDLCPALYQPALPTSLGKNQNNSMEGPSTTLRHLLLTAILLSTLYVVDYQEMTLVPSPLSARDRAIVQNSCKIFGLLCDSYAFQRHVLNKYRDSTCWSLYSLNPAVCGVANRHTYISVCERPSREQTWILF